MASSGKAKGKEKDKSQQLVQQAAPTSVDPPEREIVLGRLKESEWHQLIEQEQSSEIASGLVAEVLEVATAILFQRHLDKTVIPHAVEEAKKTLLQMVEWYFLSRDEGVTNTTSVTWTEDEEPVPAIIDSWARGIVIQTPLEMVDTPIQVVKPEVVPSPPGNELPTPPDARSSPRATSLSPSSTIPVDRHSILSPPSSTKAAKPSSHVPQKLTHHRSRPQAHKPRLVTEQPPTDSAHQSDAAVAILSDVEQHSHSLTPTSSAATCLPRPQGGVRLTQYGGVKEVTYDDKGNIVSMIKLNTLKFPSHSVKPKVTFLPTSAEESRVEVKGQLTPRGPKQQDRKSHASKKGGMVLLQPGDRGRGDCVSPGKESRRFPEFPSLPPLVDTINPAPGVTIHEGGRSVHGIRVNTPSTMVLSSLSNLRPVLPPDHHHRMPGEVSIEGSPHRRTETVP
eukprot:Em0002g1604a